MLACHCAFRKRTQQQQPHVHSELKLGLPLPAVPYPTRWAVIWLFTAHPCRLLLAPLGVLSLPSQSVFVLMRAVWKQCPCGWGTWVSGRFDPLLAHPPPSHPCSCCSRTERNRTFRHRLALAVCGHRFMEAGNALACACGLLDPSRVSVYFLLVFLVFPVECAHRVWWRPACAQRCVHLERHACVHVHARLLRSAPRACCCCCLFSVVPARGLAARAEPRRRRLFRKAVHEGAKLPALAE